MPSTDIAPPGNPPVELTKINMTTAPNLQNIKVPPKFHIEWDRGPLVKVFQVYKDSRPKPVFEKRIKNGDLISLPLAVRGQVELKTWWDDGTRNREEVFVFVPDG